MRRQNPLIEIAKVVIGSTLRHAVPHLKRAAAMSRSPFDEDLNEIARLAATSQPPAVFHSAFLRQVLLALSAPAGSVWVRTEKGNFRQVADITPDAPAFARSEEDRAWRHEQIRMVLKQNKPLAVLPGGAGSRNPTPLHLLLAPIQSVEGAVGVVQVWQRQTVPAHQLKLDLEFLEQAATLAAPFVRGQLSEPLPPLGLPGIDLFIRDKGVSLDSQIARTHQENPEHALRRWRQRAMGEAAIAKTRRAINVLVQEIDDLCGDDLSVGEFGQAFLQRILRALAVDVGAFWLRTSPGALELVCSAKLESLGEPEKSDNRQDHEHRLYEVVLSGQPAFRPRFKRTRDPESSELVRDEPFWHLLAPILVDEQVRGVVEVWAGSERNTEAVPGFLSFLTRMAELAGRYVRRRLEKGLHDS